MTDKTMENYIARLESRIKWLEMCQKDDEEERIKVKKKYPLDSANNLSAHTELLTLRTVVRDLKHFVTATPFSYWDYV